MNTTNPMTTIKANAKATWEAGDYALFATYMQPGATEILQGWDIQLGRSFLDVGCGSGQLAIPAARMGLAACGVDIAANLVEAAKARAAAENLDCTFLEGDAESLPFENDSFDIVSSIIGAMFAPRPERVAAEMMRVCRPGGRILMGNWTPDGFAGELFRTIGRHLPPPAGVISPTLWGDEDVVSQRFAATSELRMEKSLYPNWKYPFPVARVVDFFCDNFGPLVRGLPKLDNTGQGALRDDLLELFQCFNRGSDDITLIEGEYLSIEAVL